MTNRINQIRYIEEDVCKYHVYDVTYRHFLTFQQIPEYRIHIVDNLEYLHVVHDDSYYRNNVEEGQSNYIMEEIIAKFQSLL